MGKILEKVGERLCKIGVHKWTAWSLVRQKYMGALLYRRDCQRCGKIERRLMPDRG